MKKTAYGVLIAVIAFGIQGCAGKSKKASVSAESIPSALFSDVNPLHIAQYYLDNLYRPEKSQELYDLLAHETRENISFDRFTDYVHTLRVSIPADAYYTVMPYDAYVFEDKVLCYYIVVYEKNSVGGYALTELSLIRTQGIWQIAIDPGTEKFSPMPVLESGDITEFTRRDVASFKETINQRITAFLKAKQLPEEKDELLIEEPIKDKISKKIKKEMVVGQAYFEVGNFEKAKESFEKVLSYDPEDQTASELLQKSIQGMAEQEKARRESTEQLRRENDKARNAMEERIRQETEMKIQQALEQVKQKERELESLRSQQQNVVVPQKLEPLKEIPTIEDELFEECFSQGEIFYNSGDYRKAMVQFQKALGFQPENQLVQNYIKKCERAIQVVE